jgi:hypothetical protein
LAGQNNFAKQQWQLQRRSSQARKVQHHQIRLALLQYRKPGLPLGGWRTW